MMNKSHKTLALPGAVFSRPGVVFALLGLVLLTGAATLFATPLEVGPNAKPAPSTQDSKDLESLEAQIGYSVGVNMGKSMAAYDVQVDIEALLQGVRDGLSGATTKMSEAEMRGVLARMQQGAATKMHSRLLTTSAGRCS